MEPWKHATTTEQGQMMMERQSQEGSASMERE
jgi:hypothetical protein